MIARRAAPVVVLALAVVVGACSGSEASPAVSEVAPTRAPASPSIAPSPVPSAPGTPGSSLDPATPPPVVATPAPAIAAAWAQVELTDVATGETFRIADLAGRAVILETMAIWCTKCLAQQGDVYEALEQLDRSTIAYVLLDVDPNESAEALAEYRRRHGFRGTYAIADRDLARALAAEFGDQVLNPPSTPMVLIGSDGRITPTPFGPKSVDDVVRLAREHGAS